MRRLRALVGLGGLGLTAWLVWDVGPQAIGGALGDLGWRVGLLMLPQVLVNLLDAAGWRYAFPGRAPGLVPLAGGRIAGEAINVTTPTATLGGEPVKAWFVTRLGIPLDEGVTSVVVAKTALVASQLAFLAIGLGLAAWQLRLDSGLLAVMAGLTAYGVVSVAILVWAQQHGLLRAGPRVVGWLGIKAAARLAALDAQLRGFYRGQPARLSLTCLFHLFGWLSGAIEVWLGLLLLGQPVDAVTAVVIEAFVSGVRSASFLIPASLGTQEGGLVTIFVACGLSAQAGLTFGLVRRLREAVWTAVGYAVLAAWGQGRTPGRDAD